MKLGSELLREVPKPTPSLSPLCSLLRLVYRNDHNKFNCRFPVQRPRFSARPVPPPVTFRKTMTAKTAMSTYTVMTKHPISPWSTYQRSSRASPARAAWSKTPRKFAHPALTSLLEHLQDVFGVHARGNELRPILHHCGEHAFSLQIHKCHATDVHDAFAVAIRAVRLFPIRFQLR